MASKIIPNNVKVALNTAIERLLRMAGLPENYLPFSFADQINAGPYATTENMDLYVDPVNGNDSNINGPFKTIQAAINSVPKLIKHTVNINLAAGTHYVAEGTTPNGSVIISGFTIDNMNDDGNKFIGLFIHGPTTTVLANQTITSISTTTQKVATVTVSGANWTPSAYKGMWFVPTAGTGSTSNIMAVIEDNTATTLTVVGIFTTLDTSTVFSIVDAGATISQAWASNPSVQKADYPILAMSNNVYESTRAAAQSINITSVKVSPIGGSTATAAWIRGTNSFGLSKCNINGILSAYSSRLGVYQCYQSGGQFTLLRYAAGIFAECYVASSAANYSSVTESTLNSVFSMYNYTGTGTLHKAVDGGYVSSSNDTVSTTTSANVFQTTAPSAFITLTSMAHTGTSTAFATMYPGSSIVFDVGSTTTATNFISLDNGGSYTTKALVEAGTNKTVFNTSTGALAKES